jgi:hypothetical protein
MQPCGDVGSNSDVALNEAHLLKKSASVALGLWVASGQPLCGRILVLRLPTTTAAIYWKWAFITTACCRLASVSEIKGRDMRPRLLRWTEVRMNKRRMLTRPQRNCHLTLAASLSRRPPAEATRDLTFHG